MASPTQPFPTKPVPLVRQAYTEADASDISPLAHQTTLDRIRRSPNFGPFPAPGLQETIFFPGFDGGMEWGGGAADANGVYYVNVNEMPWIVQMVETRRDDGSPLPRRGLFSRAAELPRWLPRHHQWAETLRLMIERGNLTARPA